jgi:hypothetical protein
VYERLDRLGLDWLCDQLIDGRSVRSVAKELNASAVAIIKWIDREPGRMRQYQLARQAQADAIADDLIDLADEPVPIGPDGRMDSAAVNDKRLRIDTRKWIASKYRPAMYADKVQVEDVTPPGREQKPEDVMARITTLLAAHGLRIVPDDQQSVGLGDSAAGGDETLG